MRNPGKRTFLQYGKRILYMLLGNAGYALSLNLFLAGNDIAAGGFAGLGVVINGLLRQLSMPEIPLGAFMLCLTVPLIIWAFFVKDIKFMIFTLLSTLTYTSAVDLLAFLPSVTDNRLIAAICGGLLYAISSVLTIKADCSAGGTDLLAKLLMTKFRNMSLGRMFLCIDGCIVIASMIVFGEVEIGIYAVIAIAVCSYGTDAIIHGLNRACIFYIITDHEPKVISDAIMDKLHRGVTCLTGLGMYAHSQRNILLVAVKTGEVYKLKQLMQELDPAAFMFLVPASEVLGKGFSTIDLNRVESNALRQRIATHKGREPRAEKE